MSTRGVTSARYLAPNLLGLAGLLVLSLPASTQPARADACDQIKAACEQAGFVYGGANAGNGVIVDCFRPIVQAKPQPANASRPLPQVDPQLVAGCPDVEYQWNW
jgi:hypothetical protein